MRFFIMTAMVSLFLLSEAEGQAEFNMKVGVESWAIQDEVDITGNSCHAGQFIGFDMFIEKIRFLFVPGFHYHRFMVSNQEGAPKFEFMGDNHVHYFSIPITFGYEFLDIHFFSASLLAGAEGTFFFQLDPNLDGVDDDELHGIQTALTAALHTEIVSILTLEAKYHHATTQMFKERPESKLRGWTLALGVKF